MSAKLIKQTGVIFATLLFAVFNYTPYHAAADTDVTVNDTRDLPDPSPSSGPDCQSTAGTCTLRAAIQRANNQLGTHIIRLPAGTFRITRAGQDEDRAETGDFDIRGNIVIFGAGAKNTVIDAAGLDRAFDVINGSLKLQSLKVTNGTPASGGGGAIRAAAPVILNRVHLFGNNDTIFTSRDLSIVRSTITGNGPGIQVFELGSTLLIKPDIIISESTISGNGVGIFLDNGRYSVQIFHSTIAQNNKGIKALAYAGAQELLLRQVILADNAFGNANEPANCEIEIGVLVTASQNVDSDGTCGFTTDSGNLILVNPQLGPLADNGGHTPTHIFNNPLLLDAGAFPGAGCSDTDQRGFPRPFGSRCDIGAIESQGPVGIAVVEPDAATVKKHKTLNLKYLWRVPSGQNWRDLQFLDLRVRDEDEALIWLRWSEADNTFQLINPRSGRPHGRAFVAGSNHVLQTEDAQLDVRNSSSQGSGPTGTEVTLNLALSFFEKSEHNKPFVVEVTAADDSNQTQPFLAIGTIAVGPPDDR
jgi:hypothetical protein